MSLLVSVSVLTYNSSMYILETLESIRQQTYPTLELVVSDDCSTDNTVELCREWIEQNKKRFVNTTIVVSPTNKGISANYNQGMDNCTGSYIKEIAGDDLLLPNCVEDYMDFIKNHPDASFCFGRAVVFDGDEERRRNVQKLFDYTAFGLPSSQQYAKLMNSENFICSATFFFNRKVAQEKGIRNDERIPFMEDMPKWISILKSGEMLWFVDKEVVKFRCSSTSLSTQHEKSSLWKNQFALFSIYYVAPYIKAINPRKSWRICQYALQELHPSCCRKMILDCYEFMASVLRLVQLKK